MVHIVCPLATFLTHLHPLHINRTLFFDKTTNFKLDNDLKIRVIFITNVVFIPVTF